jgi:hypothetical protein
MDNNEVQMVCLGSRLNTLIQEVIAAKNKK